MRSSWTSVSARRRDENTPDDQDRAREHPAGGELREPAVRCHPGEEDAGDRAKDAEQRDADPDREPKPKGCHPGVR